MFDIISVAAIISYFVPLIIVIAKKLWSDIFFMLFATYWAVGGLINLCDILPGVPAQTCYMIGVVYNMLDIPFILAILYCTTTSSFIKKITPFAVAAIVCMEIAGVMMNGLDFDALKYSLGAGITMVLIIVVLEIIRYMQTMEHSNRQNAKMFIYAAVLFEYATFIVIYIFDYFMDSSDRQDSFIIYYISTLGAILIASCGYLLFKKYERNSQIFQI